jgi:hypothetical protein
MAKHKVSVLFGVGDMWLNVLLSHRLEVCRMRALHRRVRAGWGCSCSWPLLRAVGAIVLAIDGLE